MRLRSNSGRTSVRMRSEREGRIGGAIYTQGEFSKKRLLVLNIEVKVRYERNDRVCAWSYWTGACLRHVVQFLCGLKLQESLFFKPCRQYLARNRHSKFFWIFQPVCEAKQLSYEHSNCHKSHVRGLVGLAHAGFLGTWFCVHTCNQTPSVVIVANFSSRISHL